LPFLDLEGLVVTLFNLEAILLTACVVSLPIFTSREELSLSEI